jgi:glycosyltransferase involved in cell wall biosynthesis
MTSPLISCIVPVFNGERYLRETLDSILQQTYQPLEVIVVDDGSTDSTAAIVASYRQQIISLWQPNAGPAPARNLGLSMAQGEFIAFLDADDLWHPQKLARQMARFRVRSDLDLCVTHIQNFCSPELDDAGTKRQNLRLMQPLPGYTWATLLARRALYKAIGQLNSALQHADSTEWFLRAAEHGAVLELLPDVLVHRRLHHLNFSRHNASASRDEYLQLIKAFLDRRRRQSETSAISHFRKLGGYEKSSTE